MDTLIQHPWQSLAVFAVLILALLGRAGRLLRITRVRRRTIVVVVRGNYDPAEVASYILAQQAQIDGEFGPAFRIQATITLQAANVPVRPSPQAWPLYLDDVGDLPGALGYHSVDQQTGVPYARVFLQDSKAAGVAWQSVASHEIVEILFNPFANRTFIGPNGRPWAGECGDPVEDVEYLINGVPMSDFVLPRWFVPQPTSLPVDARHAISRPYQITPGGYAQYRAADGQWVQVSGPAGRKARK